MIPAALLLLTSFFLFKVNYFHCVLLPMYTSCLFSMLRNEDIVDTEKPDEICSLNVIIVEFSGLFLHPSIFSIKHSGSA